jgi:hypothetical protein
MSSSSFARPGALNTSGARKSIGHCRIAVGYFAASPPESSLAERVDRRVEPQLRSLVNIRAAIRPIHPMPSERLSAPF